MRISRITDWLETQDRIDRLGQPLNKAVTRAIHPGRLKDTLSGTWLGHPLHPMSVMIPIGSWTSATLMDISARGRSTPAARRLVGIGVLSAVASAMSGLADWSDTAGNEQRVGTAHATLNAAATALYAASWWARRRSPSGYSGPALAVAGMAVATGAGYLGGHLIYAQGVGVDTNAFHAGPQDWRTVAPLRDLRDGHGVAADTGGSRLLLVLQGSQVRTLENRCSHRGGPLAEGVVHGDCVTCPWHDSRFDLTTGEVVAGPATVGQPVYQTRISDGQVQVRGHEGRGLRTSPDGPG